MELNLANIDLPFLAKAVKRGVALLDRKVPNWRNTMRKHQEQFALINGEHCVLGTLEHYNGRMRVLAKKSGIKTTCRYSRGQKALGIDSGRAYGFDGQGGDMYCTEIGVLDALWRAEFEKVQR